jgi:acetate kinase
MKYILVINCGSATLKFKVFEFGNLKEIMSGIVERIGLSGSFVETKIKNKKLEHGCGARNHEESLKIALREIENWKLKIENFSVVGHRVVHGGEEFTKSTVITPAVLQKLKKYSKLAPLHNPANLMGIAACQKLLPRAKNVAVFDTAFYATLPDYAYTYALPYNFYQKYGLRRYGFHGISHQYIAEEAAEKLRRPLKNINLITCHLGSGCSITAVQKGKTVDTSMGFTPLEGLMMSTRAGDLDPAIPLYLIRDLKMKPEEAEKILNFKSGLLGICGLADMREVLTAAGYKVAGFEQKNKKTKKQKNRLALLALKIFVYRLQKYISAYAGILGKVDAIVFTGGIGERNPTVRGLIMKGLKFQGKPKILVIPTNEELMIARAIKK